MYKGSFFVSSIEIASKDISPPSVPSNLRTTSIDGDQINIAWSASTDNKGVKGYEIFKDGNRLGTTTATNYTINNLNTCTNYSLAVRAYDESGNYSEKATINAKTTTGIPVEIIVQNEVILTTISPIFNARASSTVILNPGFSVNPPANINNSLFQALVVSGDCD